MIVDAAALRVLTGQADVVDRFLDLVHVPLVVGKEPVEAVVEADPEDAAAELARVPLARERVALRRVLLVLADGHAAADVLPILADQLPRPEHGIQVAAVARGAVVVQIGIEGDDLVGVRPGGAGLPDCRGPPGGQVLHPRPADERPLGREQVVPRALRREVGQEAGDMALVVEFGPQGEAGRLGQEQGAILAVCGGQQRVGVGIAGPGRGGQAVGEHLDRVAPLVLELPTNAGHQQRAVPRPAGLDAFDQAVEPLAESGLLAP